MGIYRLDANGPDELEALLRAYSFVSFVVQCQSLTCIGERYWGEIGLEFMIMYLFSFLDNNTCEFDLKFKTFLTISFNFQDILDLTDLTLWTS